MTLVDEDGDSVSPKLLTGLTNDQIDQFEKELPCSIPKDIRELLRFTEGIDGTAVDILNFAGKDCDFGIEIFPTCLPIAHDGYGNFWVIDLNADSTEWGPIYFCSHDAPVILYQAPTLNHFLDELFKMSLAPHKSEVDDVHEDRLFDVWGKNPGVMSKADCLQSTDQNIANFAKSLEDGFEIIDLRNCKIGEGFSWGRYGPRTELMRYQTLPIFAYRKVKKEGGFFSKLFGR